MHNRFWLSFLLAVFLTASGCAKQEDTSSAADSVTPAVQTAVPAATGSVQDKSSQESDILLENNSPAPEKADTRSSSDAMKPEAAKPKALRKKESGAAEENEAKPAGDDMERMD